eukprot:3572837-Prorocentrum_lima.AAC.1
MTSSLVGSEMCIRDSPEGYDEEDAAYEEEEGGWVEPEVEWDEVDGCVMHCLLYTSDAADDM